MNFNPLFLIYFSIFLNLLELISFEFNIILAESLSIGSKEQLNPVNEIIFIPFSKKFFLRSFISIKLLSGFIFFIINVCSLGGDYCYFFYFLLFAYLIIFYCLLKMIYL